MDTDKYKRFSRTIAVIGPEAFARLQAARVAVFGLGGVGAACAEALARGGVGTVALVDHDKVSKSNLNRQLIALHSTLGQAKTAVLARRLLDISPDMIVREHPLFFDESTRDLIDFTAYDAVADCIDTLEGKLLLAGLAGEYGYYLVSCMGAGNRLDPGQLSFADIYDTSVCPLARRMRKACRERGIKALRALYSREEPVKAVGENAHGRHAPGSVSFVPPVAGFMMAGDIIRHLIANPQAPGRQPQALP